MTNHGLVLIDLDGCLVNWVGGALKLIGRSEREQSLQEILLSGEHPPFDALFGGREYLDAVVRKAGKDFWMNLEVFDWAERLIEIVRRSGLRSAFLTSHGAWPEAAGFKIEFLAERWGDIPVFIGKQKGVLGHPGSLLIDDFHLNIAEFHNHGGNVFHWPNYLLLQDDDDLVDTTLRSLEIALQKLTSFASQNRVA